MYGNDMADFKRQIIVVKDSSQLNYEDSQSVKNVNEIIEGRKNTLSPDLSNFIKIKLQEKKKSSKVSLKTPYLLLSDNNLCNSRNKNNSLKTENSNIAKFPDLKTSNSKLDSTLDSEIIRLKDSKLCSLHSLDTEEKIYSVCNNVLITDSPVLSCKKKNEVKNVLGLKRKLIRKRLFSNVSDKKESMKSNYTFTLKGLHDEKQNPECKNTSEKANSPSNSCSVTNYQNIVSKVEESIEQNKSPNNNISAPYSPILSKCFTKSIKNKSHIRYNCKEMDSVESVLKPVSTLKNVQSLLSTEVIEQSNSLVEHREPYVISPIKFISSQENSVKDLLIKSSNVGVEQDVNVGKNVTNTFHTPLKNNSLCFSKLSEKDQSYFESDEVNTISEFPSPVESEEMYPRYNDKSQTRRTSNFDKVWSIEKNYFENVFKNSKSEKNFEIEYSFSPDDKLKVNKMLSMSTLDKRLSDFSNTFNEFVENSNNISEISSESSPEKNVNTVIETNLNRKRIMLLDTEHVKKKRSNNISPILGIRFNSEKPHCSKYIQELQSDLDGTKFNSEIYNDSTEVCNESTSGFEKKLVDSKSKTASQDGFSNHGNCSLVKQNNQITTSIKNKEEPFLEPITYIHKYQESSEGDLNKSGFFMENDVSDNVVVRNTQSCCSLQINRREYDFIENKQEVLSCTPSNSQISQVIIETVSSPSEATSNKSVDEIQFSDTTSLNTEPQTPPFKVQPEKEKEIFELDSASKKHRKYPDDSLVTRIRILKNRYESNARLWQHMLSNNDNSSKKNHPIFIVKAIWNEYSNTIINCTHLNDTDTDNDVLLTTFEDITTVNTVVNNELHVLINSTVFLPANISRGCNIRIHPPWVPDSKMWKNIRTCFSSKLHT
ncbi:uncharacterized protein LOC142334175 isoform X2 [Lycorma delicatula]|uniref:uncharacterized protein LOC142334175 isoform X2 n=1 Tax=Lycorma delicatula TaxID=130591 RepID=UPI003F50FD50